MEQTPLRQRMAVPAELQETLLLEDLFLRIKAMGPGEATVALGEASISLHMAGEPGGDHRKLPRG